MDPARGANGAAVWNWDLQGEAFGTTPPNENPDGDANLFVLNMRFSGQRYDAVSGLITTTSGITIRALVDMHRAIRLAYTAGSVPMDTSLEIRCATQIHSGSK